MDIKKVKQAQFEAMLRLAVNESFEKEMAAIPPREELEKLHTVSERHKLRMKKLIALDRH